MFGANGQLHPKFRHNHPFATYMLRNFCCSGANVLNVLMKACIGEELHLYTFQVHFIVMILSLVERVGPCETKNHSIIMFKILGNTYHQEITYLYVPGTPSSACQLTTEKQTTCSVVVERTLCLVDDSRSANHCVVIG